MLPSNIKLKIKTGTVRYNNKILISDEKFILGKNDEVNLMTPAIKNHKTNSLETPTIKSHKTEPTVGVCSTLSLRAVNKELTPLIILLTKTLSSIESPVDELTFA